MGGEVLTSGGRLAGIDVADNDDVKMSLVLLTVERLLASILDDNHHISIKTMMI